MNLSEVNQKDIELVNVFLANKPNNVKIYKGIMQSNIMLDNMFAQGWRGAKLQQISNYIKEYQEVNVDARSEWKTRDENTMFGNSMSKSDPSWKLYNLGKLKYLIESIPNDGVFAPFVLMNTERNEYKIHPGSDRAAIMSLLQTRNITLPVKIYWIWYEDLYPNARLLDDMDSYEEITTAEQFFEQFVKSDYEANSFFDLTLNVTKTGVSTTSSCDYYDSYIPEKHMTYKSFLEWGATDLPEVVTFDWLNWEPKLDKVMLVKHRSLVDDIYFEDDCTFNLGKFVFTKRYPFNDDYCIWLPSWISDETFKNM